MINAIFNSEISSTSAAAWYVYRYRWQWGSAALLNETYTYIDSETPQ
jgi:hypothetical protein